LPLSFFQLPSMRSQFISISCTAVQATIVCFARCVFRAAAYTRRTLFALPVRAAIKNCVCFIVLGALSGGNKKGRLATAFLPTLLCLTAV